MLPDIPAFMWVLVALGAVVALAIGYGILLLAWEVLCAFARACSFTKFRFRVGDATGHARKFGFGMFLHAWWHMLGWRNGSQTITLKGGHFKGYNNYTVFGKFVSPQYVPDEFHESDDDELEEDDK